MGNFESDIPEILESQVELIEWANELFCKFFSKSKVLEFLISGNTDEKFSELNVTLYHEKFRSYNIRYKDALIEAIIKGYYRLSSNPSEGDIATNGTFVGFVKNIDYNKRKFSLTYEKGGKIVVSDCDLDKYQKL